MKIWKLFIKQPLFQDHPNSLYGLYIELWKASVNTSPLHNKFRMPSEEAFKEAAELLELKNSHQIKIM